MTKRAPRLASCLLAGAMMLAFSSPAVGCSFQKRGGLSLVFGNLDPSSGANVPATFVVGTNNADKWGGCANTTMTMSATSLNGGFMKNAATGASIQYSVTLPPNTTTGNGNGYMQFALSAIVYGMDYIDAPAGSYTDSLTIMVAP